MLFLECCRGRRRFRKRLANGCSDCAIRRLNSVGSGGREINIVADADTVQLFIDEATQNGLHPIEVSTGGNFLANAAKLDIHGTDSAVMAQNGVYSDVVLYQAGMYDTDDAPLGPQGAGLASEAVAFLADGLIHDCGPGGEEDPGGLVMIDSGGGSGSFDTLGGMVT